MKLNGYRASHRNKWFLITDKILTPQEFLLLEYYLDLMDFDKRHEDKFATFEAYLDEVAPIFNKHEDTAKKWHDGLISKQFVKVSDEKRNLYTVKSPLRYVVGLSQWGGEASKYAKEEKGQKIEFILENIRFSPSKSEKILPKSETLALKPSISVKNSLSSSKDEYRVNSKGIEIEQEVRSDEEYQNIYDEGNFLNLTPKDMKWIDQNIKAGSLSNKGKAVLKT